LLQLSKEKRGYFMQNYAAPPKEGFKEKRRYELLNGKIYNMAGASSNHNAIIVNIAGIFGNFLKGKKCRAFVDGVDVHLSETDITMPDVMIVCDRDIIKKNGIYGAPDLTVEVLSPSTAEMDMGYKKDLYEKHGVKEYWIISQAERSIQVYLLKNGVYKLDKIYQIFEDYVLEKMDEEEKAAIIMDFKTSLDGFGDLIINVEEVFENVE